MNALEEGFWFSHPNKNFVGEVKILPVFSIVYGVGLMFAPTPLSLLPQTHVCRPFPPRQLNMAHRQEHDMSVTHIRHAWPTHCKRKAHMPRGLRRRRHEWFPRAHAAHRRFARPTQINTTRNLVRHTCLLPNANCLFYGIRGKDLGPCLCCRRRPRPCSLSHRA